MRVGYSNRFNEHAAHEFVTVSQATEGYEATGIDWPVSGDYNRIDYGRVGLKNAYKSVNIFKIRD